MPLPPGYSLDAADQAPPQALAVKPPPGYTIDQQTETSQPKKNEKHWWEPGSGVDPNKQHAAMDPNAQVMGSPILPSAQIIPAAIGYGVSKTGEAFGLPDWANTAAGVVAGGLASGAGSLVSKARSMSPAKSEKLVKAATDAIPYFGKKINAIREAMAPEVPVAPAPVRPNPAIAAKMPYGGPAEEYSATSYGPPTRAGGPITPIEPPATPAPFKPLKRNTNIARKLKSGGLEDDYSAPAYGPPVRQSGTPALEQPAVRTPSSASAPPQYTGPNKVNPNISKKLRFTPGGEDQFSGSAGDQAGSTLGTRAEMMRQVRLKTKSLQEGTTAQRMGLAVRQGLDNQ